MDTEVRKQLRWVRLSLQIGSYSIVSLPCGISRPTRRKWVGRYERIGEREREWILAVRKRRLGSRRIQSELSRIHAFEVSWNTIDQVLSRADAKPFLKSRWKRKQTTRYAQQIPGGRVPMDTCRIVPGLYQYRVVDAAHSNRPGDGHSLPSRFNSG